MLYIFIIKKMSKFNCNIINNLTHYYILKLWRSKFI